MLILHLGVLDQPYADPSASAPKRARKARKGRQALARTKKGSQSQTTGDVANILERQYGIMGMFYALHQRDVDSDIADSMAATLDNLIAGAPASALTNPLAGAEEKIGERFREFIDSEEMAILASAPRGRPVPTKAALKGVSHRFKHPYAKGHPRRPSFVDTGLYRASFKAWFDGFRALLGGA